MFNVSNLLVVAAPYLKPLVIQVLKMLLTRLAAEAKAGQLHVTLGEFSDEVEALALAAVKLLDGQTISAATPTT